MRRPPSNCLFLFSPILSAVTCDAFTPSLCTTRHLSTSSHTSCAPSPQGTALQSTSRLSTTPSSQPQPLATSGDWSAYLDESKGLIYYFHRRTGESTWDPPPDIHLKVELSGDKKKQMRERLRNYLEERLGDAFLQDSDALLGEQTTSAASSVTKFPQDILADKRRSGVLAAHGPWIALVDEKRGMIYYHDEASNVTTWNRPPSFPFIKLSASRRRELQEQNRRYLEWRKEGTVKKVNVLGKGTVVAKEIRSELDSLDKIQKDIDSRLQEVSKRGKAPIYKDEEWAAYLDDTSGLVYYYNVVEKTSVWDPPSEEFLELVKGRMIEDPKSFVTDDEYDVMREIDSEEGNVASDNQTDSEQSLFFLQEIEDENLAQYPVDYDAAARLAYESAGSAGEFEVFKLQYVIDASNMVANKHKKRMDDELARIAPEIEITREEQKKEQEEDRNLARYPVDYDAAARLAYESAGSAGEFEVFKLQYVTDASNMVATKFKGRLETRSTIEDEAALKKENTMKQTPEGEETSVILSDVEENPNAETPFPTAELKRTIVQTESVPSTTVMDEISIIIEDDTTPPDEIDVQPELPKDDPFISGSNVASLISPLKSETLYDILQCDISATRSEIKQSYLTLAKETHPDALLQNGVIGDKEAEKKFNEIAQAYKILSDPTERRRYNRELKAKGLSRSAGSMFENWVMGAAKAMDEALTKAERDLESNKAKENP
jgi:hypothetical protein